MISTSDCGLPAALSVTEIVALRVPVAVGPKVTEIVSGHTHVGRDASVERPPHAPVRARVIGSVYGAPALVRIEVPRPKMGA